MSTMFAAILWLSVISLIAYSLYKWATQNNNYFAKRGIRHLKPTFFFGNTGKFFFQLIDTYQFVDHLYYAYPTEKLSVNCAYIYLESVHKCIVSLVFPTESSATLTS